MPFSLTLMISPCCLKQIYSHQARWMSEILSTLLTYEMIWSIAAHGQVMVWKKSKKFFTDIVSILIIAYDVKKNHHKMISYSCILLGIGYRHHILWFLLSSPFFMNIEVINLETFTHTHIVLDRPGQYIYFFYAATETKKPLTINLVHSDITLVCRAIVVWSHDYAIDFSLQITHQAPRTSSDTSLLGLAYTQSSVSLGWTVIIEKNHHDCHGHLTQKTMILGSKIKIFAKPVLDIRNNAVTASHGATIEKLDPIKLFYMQAKGLSLTQSRHMMVDAEVQTVLEPLLEHQDLLTACWWHTVYHTLRAR